MLTINVPETEFFDEKQEIFVNVHATTLKLEHSLVSVSKWEAKWKKPFLTEKEKSTEEILDYIKDMTLTQNVPDLVYMVIGSNRGLIEKIFKYINDPMTATTIKEDKKPRNTGKFITNELIYYWMTQLNIPMECQKWHLNRLLTLIKVCDVESSPKKKMSKSEVLKHQAALNAARRKPKV